MSEWNLAAARHTYSIPHWSEGYVDLDARARLCVQPTGTPARQIALCDVLERATAAGLRLPLLLRFTDILADKRARMQQAFARAMQANHYPGRYTAVYPIKVNQNRSVAGELAGSLGDGFGLEAGSKAELIAVLALAERGIVVCNGYKDREYIRLALIGRKLGLDIFIVIEKPSELELVIAEARALAVAPLLGVRVRLASIAGGKWQNTGGDKAKFGLNPGQLMELLAALDAAGLRESLGLLHFHMGSQISNVRDIAGGMREAVRYFIELKQLGFGIDHLDVGGGLGVDYEGTRSRSDCSINYSLDQYASTVVQALAEACREHGVEAPHLITEAGRAMTAHHAVLVANVSEVEVAPAGAVPPAQSGESHALQHLREIHAAIGERPPLELYHEAQHYLAEGQSMFALGQLALTERAALDQIFYAIAHAVRARLRPDERAHRAALDELNEKLTDKYFVNFSVFQSMPDIWAIGQVFPIVPIDRLDQAPERHGVIADLTCDSDGRIDRYVDSEGIDASLPLHALAVGERYRLGFFLVGAYQETLGDIHNLFGDTDTVDVRLSDEGFELRQARPGDSAERVLGYVGFEPADLRAAFAAKLAAADLTPALAKQIAADLEAGLGAYTYLQSAP